jgi:hypothetical protein
MQQHDEESVKIFTTPGMAQAKVIAKIANVEEVATMSAIVVDLMNNRLQLTVKRSKPKYNGFGNTFCSKVVTGEAGETNKLVRILKTERQRRRMTSIILKIKQLYF